MIPKTTRFDEQPKLQKLSKIGPIWTHWRHIGLNQVGLSVLKMLIYHKFCNVFVMLCTALQMFRIIAIEIPGGGAYFGTYYYLVNSLRPAGSERGQLSIPRTLFAGGMAGIMNWIVMLPPDVAKSRYQTAPAGQYKGIFSVYAELIREGGIRSLYKGFTPVFLRAFPANAGCFLGFELAIKVLNWAFPE